MRSLTRHLTPANVLSVPVFGVTFVWTALLHFSDARTIAAGIGWPRIAAFVVAQVFMFAVLALGALGVRRMSGRGLVVGTVGVIVLAAAARGWCFDVLLVGLGGVTQSALGYFVLTSTVIMGVALALTSIIVGEVRAHRTTKARLLAEQESLLLMTRRAAEQVRQVDDRAVTEIQTQLLRVFEPAATGDATAVLASLRSAIDDVARPISHALESAALQWTPPVTSAPRLPTDWRSAISQAFRPQAIRPIALAVTAAVLAMPAALVREGVVTALLVGIYIALVGVLALHVARTIARRSVDRSLGRLPAVAFFMALVAAGIVIGLSTLIPLSASSQPAYLLVQIILFIPFLGAIVGLVEATRARATAVESQLQRTDADLRWALIRTRETERQHKRAVAQLLHGRVQSALSAAHVKVSKLEAAGAVDPVDLDVIRRDVEAAIALLSTEVTRPTSAADAVAKTQATWAGIVNIAVDLDPALGARIERDPIASGTLSDLLPELCFNAVKHASASRIDITLRPAGEGVLELTVANDGQGVGRAPAPGLGDQLLATSTLGWTRHRSDGRTVTSALIPLP